MNNLKRYGKDNLDKSQYTSININKVEQANINKSNLLKNPVKI